MRINKLKLQNFRSYTRAEWDLDGQTIICGNNGTGKSNVLEAIYLLASGKSFRAETEGEMIKAGQTFANVEGETDSGQLRIFLSDGLQGYARKKFEVNQVARRMVDMVGLLRAVLFGPADMELLTGSPSGRRKYLDLVLGQADGEYRRCLLSYEKGLRQRNRLLERIREGTAETSQLFFWDRLLIKDGEYLTRERQAYLERVNTSANAEMAYTTEYDRSLISEQRLRQYAREEVAAAATLVGPHRDDFEVKLELGGDYKAVEKYGSRGQQRMAMLWLKLAEREYLKTEAGWPVLLLDDIYSELDHGHRQQVWRLTEEQVQNGGQVIMTTADEHLIPRGKAQLLIKLD